MKKLSVLLLLALLLSMLLVSTVVQAAPSDKACWGQASKVFAQTGEMGEHSSQFPTPRVGLANLARALYDQGVIGAPTMQALGAIVAAELGLEIDACMSTP